MPNLAIINYGMGNIRNVQRAIEKAGSKVKIIDENEGVKKADAIILPGVGAFKKAIANLIPFRQSICKKVESGTPLLGICLGLQLLFTESTEGGLNKGFDILKGRIVRLPTGIKIPHIGWNTLTIVKTKNPLVKDIPNNSYVYFIPSYYARVKKKDIVVANTNYGIDFPTIVSKRHVFATQFHPEKSGNTGLQILKNFVEIVRK